MFLVRSGGNGMNPYAFRLIIYNKYASFLFLKIRTVNGLFRGFVIGVLFVHVPLVTHVTGAFSRIGLIANPIWQNGHVSRMAYAFVNCAHIDTFVYFLSR